MTPLCAEPCEHVGHLHSRHLIRTETDRADWTKFEQRWSPMSAGLGPNSAKFGWIRPGICQLWSDPTESGCDGPPVESTPKVAARTLRSNSTLRAARSGEDVFAQSRGDPAHDLALYRCERAIARQTFAQRCTNSYRAGRLPQKVRFRRSFRPPCALFLSDNVVTHSEAQTESWPRRCTGDARQSAKTTPGEGSGSDDERFQHAWEISLRRACVWTALSEHTPSYRDTASNIGLG